MAHISKHVLVMATYLKSRSFRKNLLFSVLSVFLLFATCFGTYQYKREKQFKIDIMHACLQTYNHELFQALGADSLVFRPAFLRYVSSHPIEGLRVTVLDTLGHVLQDSSRPQVSRLGNHLQRREVSESVRQGSGYDIKRTSASTHATYFYSATRIGPFIVRTAVPYSTALTTSLQPDPMFLFFTLMLTLLLFVVMYVNVSRIASHVAYLRDFALKASRGACLDHNLERQLPDDDLGEISHTIITLFARLRQSEEEKIRMKHQLTQNVAHELKTPAASIHGFLETILQHPDMPADKRQHFIARCYAQSKRMTQLLQDMSALTRLDEIVGQEGAKLSYVSLDVALLVDQVLGDVAIEAEKLHIELCNELPRPTCVLGDERLIYGIFRNLVDNALAHAQGATCVSIRCAELYEELPAEGGGTWTRESYEFLLSDNGRGVDPPHLPHLFERFYRVDEGRSRKAGGTGLGLAIVKNSVVAHGGSVVAEPTLGGGLCVRFTLPRA